MKECQGQKVMGLYTTFKKFLQAKPKTIENLKAYYQYHIAQTKYYINTETCFLPINYVVKYYGHNYKT